MRLKKIFFTFLSFSCAVDWSVYENMYLVGVIDSSSTLADAKTKCIDRIEKVVPWKTDGSRTDNCGVVLPLGCLVTY